MIQLFVAYVKRFAGLSTQERRERLIFMQFSQLSGVRLFILLIEFDGLMW